MGEAPGFDVKLSREAASIVRFAGYLLDLEACVLAPSPARQSHCPAASSLC